MQYSDYFAGLKGEGTRKKPVCGLRPYLLRKNYFFENIEIL